MQAFEQSPNPYEPSSDRFFAQSGDQHFGTPTKVKAPGIALIVVGALNAVYAVVNGIGHLLSNGKPGRIPAEFANDPAMRQLWKAMNEADPVVGTIMSVVLGAIAVVIMFGGMRMLSMRNYPLAVTASILSMLPCLTCLGCCGVGQMVGIWGLVVLLSEDVRPYFQAGAPV